MPKKSEAKQEDRHSPLPWRYEGERILDASGDVVAAFSYAYDSGPLDIKEEDGIFIVKAVNAHDQDQEIKRELLEALEAAKRDFVMSNKRWESEDLVDAAIQNAERG